jgi:DNA-binding SARP family transcriptional activator
VTVQWVEPTLAAIDDAVVAVPSGDGSAMTVDGADERAGMSERRAAGTGRRAVVEVAPSPVPDGAPAVLVLGPVEVRGAAGPVEPTKRHRLTELAAYLALNPGKGYSALDEALWPGRRISVNARNTMVSKLRRWLGQDHRGRPYLPLYSSDHGYRLSEDVFSDWDEWWRLLAPGAAATDTPVLRAALGLVRGRPFDGVRTRAYAWAEYPRQRLIGSIVDACSELARRDVEAGRWASAEETATQGLMLEPGMERLWRLRILAARGRRDAAAVRRIVDRMLATLDELGGDLEPETERLIGDLEGDPSLLAARSVYLA